MEAVSLIAICGAGPVGLATAIDLCQRGIAPERLLLLDAKHPDQAARDPRSIALSHGSRLLLEQVSGWDRRLGNNPIRRIHVSRRGHFGRTLINAEDQHVPALGYVARYGDIVQPLQRRVQELGIPQQFPVTVVAFEESRDEVTLRLQDGASRSAALVIQAEGGIFGEQPSRAKHRDYQQMAIIAHVRADAPASDQAFERFTDHGPLALLPQDGGYAMVWCTTPERAQDLLTLDDTSFLNALQQMFGLRAGRFIEAGTRMSFALGLNAEEFCTARRISIGNAAQTLHPVAGQGLNLGLRDASVLAQHLARQSDAGVFEQYLSERRLDRSLTIALTDTMARIYADGGRSVSLQHWLGSGLAALDLLTGAKQALAAHMMFGHR